jgi:hypothetical protein
LQGLGAVVTGSIYAVRRQIKRLLSASTRAKQDNTVKHVSESGTEPDKKN